MKDDAAKKARAWLFWPSILLIVATAIWVNGISLVPPQHYQRLSENPFITRRDIAPDNYWQETVLLPLIAFHTGLSSPISFNILCFFMVVAAYVCFAALARNRFGDAPATVFTAILAASPLTTILISWLGTPDGLTVLLAIPLFFTNSTPLIFLLCLLGVNNHLVFIITAFEILILRGFARENVRPRHLAAALLGGTAGYFSVRLFLMAHQIQVMSRLEFVLSRNLSSWIGINLANFPLTLFSFFNIQWLVVFACTFAFYYEDRRFFSLIWALLFFNYGIAFFTLDTTRIFLLLSWVILLQCVFHSYHLSTKNRPDAIYGANNFLKMLAIVGALSFFMPKYYSWEGTIQPAPFFANLLRILK